MTLTRNDVDVRDRAARLRGFGLPGILAILVILAGALVGPLVSSVLVLVWARLSRTPWRELGFRRPRSVARMLPAAVVVGIALKLVMKAVVMPLLGAPPVNAPFHYLAGNAGALPAMIVMVLTSAAIGEEVFFRGYLFERLGALFGRGSLALAGTTLFSTAVFAVAHYQGQGIPGVEQAAVVGLVFGALYAWRRQIWFLMAVHAAFDLTAVAIIYWDLEEAIAQTVL